MKMIGRTVLITGGTSGIGIELARQLIVRGNTVLVTGRDLDRLEAARQTLPGLHVFQSDVSDPSEHRVVVQDRVWAVSRVEHAREQRRNDAQYQTGWSHRVG